MVALRQLESGLSANLSNTSVIFGGVSVAEQHKIPNSVGFSCGQYLSPKKGLLLDGKGSAFLDE